MDRGKHNKQTSRSRGETFAAEKREPQMPDVCAEYLIEYWHDAGLVQPRGMGVSILSSCELQAWQDGSGIALTPWEFSMLRAMSSAYVGFLREAEDPCCPAPFGAVPLDRDAVAKKVRSALQSLTRT